MDTSHTKGLEITPPYLIELSTCDIDGGKGIIGSSNFQMKYKFNFMI